MRPPKSGALVSESQEWSPKSLPHSKVREEKGEKQEGRLKGSFWRWRESRRMWDPVSRRQRGQVKWS